MRIQRSVFFFLAFSLATPLILGCSPKSTDSPNSEQARSPVESSTLTISEDQTPQTPGAITSNEFRLEHDYDGNMLGLSLITDLPEFAIVSLTVSRGYLEKDSTTRYTHEYYTEKKTARDWRSRQEIVIDNDAWQVSLKEKQEEMSRIGLGFEVGQIDPDISVRAVLPVNQPDPAFGSRNENLTGTIVPTSGLRVLSSEILIPSPLGANIQGMKSSPSLDPLNLDANYTYVLSRRTPLMPSPDPNEPLQALADVRQLQPGFKILVLESTQQSSGKWYRVKASNNASGSVGEGWINGTALLGQKLVVSE